MFMVTPAALSCCIAALIVALVSVPANAQSFPTKPIELILPAASGGTTDTAVRLMAGRWQEFLGQPVVVVNVAGAGGALGANRVARAKPDGYTLMGAFDSLLVALPFVQKNVEYNLDSFDYLTGFGLGAVYFSVRADAPYKTMGQFIDAAKKADGHMNYASYGIGVITHFAAERLMGLSGVKMAYLPYKSSPESVFALLGGQVDLAVTAGAGPAGKNPKVRMLAVASEQRRPDYPDVPTLKELGYPVSLDFISGVLAPKGLPADVRAKLQDAFKKAHDKYGNEFRQELVSKADLLYVDMPGADMHKTWRERQAWFREIAPSMNLEQK
jgi:tripartite-type tricarboxylate transporter receptor subunit TctC